MTRELVSVSEAARRTGVPRRTIGDWIRTQRLFPVGLDTHGHRLVDMGAVATLAAAHRPRKRKRKPRDTPTRTVGP